MDASELKMSWFTVEEIAELLKISRSNVYQLVSRGLLAAHRIGQGRGCIRISESDLNAFLACARHVAKQSQVAPVRRRSERAGDPPAFRHLNVSRVLDSKRRPKRH